MRKFLLGLAVCVMMINMGSSANATVLNFDSPSLNTGSSSSIVNGYGGFNWVGMGIINTSAFVNQPNGYLNGTVSGNQVAFNEYGNFGITTNANENFDFKGVYLTGAWNDNLSINVMGLLDGVLKYNKTVIASAFNATYFNFNYSDIDQLIFNSTGGTSANFGGGGTHFAMDNFDFQKTAPVPEPATMMLFGSGIAGLVGMARRRKLQA